MKKKKFKWLKILGIIAVIIILLAIVIKTAINNVSDNISDINESELNSVFYRT